MNQTATERADQILAMTERLNALVTAEIRALAARRLDGAGADWEEKERLVHAYRLEIANLKANPQALDGARPDQRQKLRDGAERLEQALDAHAQALAAMKVVTEGLVRAIADEVASARSAPTGYGRSGGVEPQRRDASGLTVNAKA